MEAVAGTASAELERPPDRASLRPAVCNATLTSEEGRVKGDRGRDSSLLTDRSAAPAPTLCSQLSHGAWGAEGWKFMRREDGRELEGQVIGHSAFIAKARPGWGREPLMGSLSRAYPDPSYLSPLAPPTNEPSRCQPSYQVKSSRPHDKRPPIPLLGGGTASSATASVPASANPFQIRPPSPSLSRSFTPVPVSLSYPFPSHPAAIYLTNSGFIGCTPSKPHIEKSQSANAFPDISNPIETK